MHGPAEVDFADKIFSKVESSLGIEQYSVKLGIMDEERRTSVNLKRVYPRGKKTSSLHKYWVSRSYWR